MKRKQAVFFGFIVMIIMAVTTMAGCNFSTPGFPPGFYSGNWNGTADDWTGIWVKTQ